MARAAQYIIIDDPNLYGFNAELDFNVPFNCYLNRPSILTWMMNLSMNDGTASMDVSINCCTELQWDVLEWHLPIDPRGY